MITQERLRADEASDTAITVLENGWVTLEQLRRAYADRYNCRPQIGELALTQGKLAVAQVFEVLGQQAATGDFFGEVALQMGYLAKNDLYELLELQNELTPTLADTLAKLGMISLEQAANLLNLPTAQAE